MEKDLIKRGLAIYSRQEVLMVAKKIWDFIYEQMRPYCDYGSDFDLKVFLELNTHFIRNMSKYLRYDEEALIEIYDAYEFLIMKELGKWKRN